MATNNSSDYSPTQYNVQSGGANGTLNNIAPSTSGYVLTSNGASAQPTFQAAAASGIVTIDGDSGSVTGSTVTIYANQTGNNTGSSVSFTNSGTTSTFSLRDSNDNVLLGYIAGNTTLSGTANVGIGTQNLHALTSGYNNTAVGGTTLSSVTTGANNTSLGANAATGITTGNYNVLLGNNVASNYSSSESSNILIANAGTAAESNVIRIGTQGTGNGQQNKCFIAGIEGVSVSNLNYVTINTSTGQLGSTASVVTGPGSSTSNGIATWSGTGGTALLSPASPTITSAGIMTNSNQPIFSAYNSGTLSNKTGDGTTYTVILNSTYLNVGTSYSTSTGLFTAPVAGNYLFTACINASTTSTWGTAGASNGGFYSPSATTVYGVAYATTAAGSVTTNSNLTISQIIPMTASQTMSLLFTAYTTAATKNTSLVAAQVSFCGFLLC